MCAKQLRVATRRATPGDDTDSAAARMTRSTSVRMTSPRDYRDFPTERFIRLAPWSQSFQADRHGTISFIFWNFILQCEIMSRTASSGKVVHQKNFGASMGDQHAAPSFFGGQRENRCVRRTMTAAAAPCDACIERRDANCMVGGAGRLTPNGALVGNFAPSPDGTHYGPAPHVIYKDMHHES